MVVFLAKSAACIGLVAAVASGVGGGDLAAAVGRGARSLVEGAGRSCLRSDPCRSAGVGALAGAAAPAPLPDAARPTKPVRVPRSAGG